MSDQTNDNSVITTIIQSCFTLKQVHHRLPILKRFLIKKLFGEEDSITSDEDINSERSWLNSLDASFYNQFTSQNVYQIFESLEKQVQALSPLVLYLSFEPSQKEIEEIGSWFRKNFSPSFIF